MIAQASMVSMETLVVPLLRLWHGWSCDALAVFLMAVATSGVVGLAVLLSSSPPPPPPPSLSLPPHLSLCHSRARALSLSHYLPLSLSHSRIHGISLLQTVCTPHSTHSHARSLAHTLIYAHIQWSEH